jgi:hypothetical protein
MLGLIGEGLALQIMWMSQADVEWGAALQKQRQKVDSATCCAAQIENAT